MLKDDFISHDLVGPRPYARELILELSICRMRCYDYKYGVRNLASRSLGHDTNNDYPKQDCNNMGKRARSPRETTQEDEGADREKRQHVDETEEEPEPAHEAEEELQPTNIEEYINACHTCIFSMFTVEPNRGLSSSSFVPDRPTKWCPETLQPWTSFIDEQRINFGKLNETFPMESRVFEPSSYVAAWGQRHSHLRVADEESLHAFIRRSVWIPISIIMMKIGKVEKVRAAFNITGGIMFQYGPHALGDTAPEVVKRKASGEPQVRPGQFCVARSDNETTGARTTVYISEYKSPRKLTVEHLRAGLCPMRIYDQFVNQWSVPAISGPSDRFVQHAQRLTATAIRQTYHYMIESGLEYGSLTTGEATVFLKIDWNQPETLFYHLSEPNFEVWAHPSNSYICTAVGQYLAFTLMALGSPGEDRIHGQDERQWVMSTLKDASKYYEDFEITLRSIPGDELSAPMNHPSRYIYTTYDKDRSPYAPHTGQPQSGIQQTVGIPQLPYEYCTPRCLYGLVWGWLLDPNCPNVVLHRPDGLIDAPHSITLEEWSKDLESQLKSSLDVGITRLKDSGARGVLFKVTLLKYGYTFVGKGTVQAFISDLEHEAEVYHRLRKIQGVHVPVFLGAINLESTKRLYHYSHQVYLEHMIFMSWGGDCLNDMLKAGEAREGLEEMATQALTAIHRQQVVHNDVVLANMLFDREAKKVVFIDFERASLIHPPLPKNKKEEVPEKVVEKCVIGKGHKFASKWYLDAQEANDCFAGDNRDVRMMFFHLRPPPLCAYTS